MKNTSVVLNKAPGQNKLAGCGLARGFARGFRPRKYPRNISNIPAVFPEDAPADETGLGKFICARYLSIDWTALEPIVIVNVKGRRVVRIYRNPVFEGQ